MGVGIRFLTERGNTERAEDTVFNLDSLGLLSQSCLRQRAGVQERTGLGRVWGVISKGGGGGNDVR